MATWSILTIFSFLLFLHTTSSLVEHGKNRLAKDTSISSNYSWWSASENPTTENSMGLTSTELEKVLAHFEDDDDENDSTDSVTDLAKKIQAAVKYLAMDLESVKTAVVKLRQKQQMLPATSQCGELIMLTGLEHEFHYRIPEGVQSVSCVWVLWPRITGHIHIRNAPNEQTNFGSNFQLQVATNITYTHLVSPPKLGLGDGLTLLFDRYNSHALLYFNANRTFEGNQGFHVKIFQTNADGQVTYTPTLKFITPQGTNGIFKYPSGERSHYGPYETVFVIGRVPDGKSLDWVLNYDMLQNYDYVFINWLHYSTPVRYGRSGGYGKISGGISIPEGSSYVLTIISTTAVPAKGGILFHYTYNDY